MDVAATQSRGPYSPFSYLIMAVAFPAAILLAAAGAYAKAATAPPFDVGLFMIPAAWLAGGVAVVFGLVNIALGLALAYQVARKDWIKAIVALFFIVVMIAFNAGNTYLVRSFLDISGKEAEVAETENQANAIKTTDQLQEAVDLAAAEVKRTQAVAARTLEAMDDEDKNQGGRGSTYAALAEQLAKDNAAVEKANKKHEAALAALTAPAEGESNTGPQVRSRDPFAMLVAGLPSWLLEVDLFTWIAIAEIPVFLPMLLRRSDADMRGEPEPERGLDSRGMPQGGAWNDYQLALPAPGKAAAPDPGLKWPGFRKRADVVDVEPDPQPDKPTDADAARAARARAMAHRDNPAAALAAAKKNPLRGKGST